jgi:hypothetical protein
MAKRPVTPESYVGPGGLIFEAPSESATIDRVLLLLSKVRGTAGQPDYAHAVSLLQDLRRQVAAGYHRNPARRTIPGRIAQLVREGFPDGHGQAGAIAYREARARGEIPNPKLLSAGEGFQAGRVVGAMSVDVHSLAYTHLGDGQDYRHRFPAGSALLWAVIRQGRRELHLTQRDGQPLWEDI